MRFILKRTLFMIIPYVFQQNLEYFTALKKIKYLIYIINGMILLINGKIIDILFFLLKNIHTFTVFKNHNPTFKKA